MATAAPAILRIPLILLAVLNLIILAIRLRPWPDVVNLPGNGTVAFDPVIILVVYIFLFLWIGGNRDGQIRRGLAIGTLFGFVAGLVLVAQVLLAARHDAHPGIAGIAMFVFAGILCGVAGMRATGKSGNFNIGLVTGVWSAMVSCLMACTAVLAQIHSNPSAPLSRNPWKQYQGLAVGNQATQALTHWLIMAAAFLLIGPLIGGAAGLCFALSNHSD